MSEVEDEAGFAEPKRKSSKTTIVVLAVLGGCLFLVLAVVLVGALGYWYVSSAEESPPIEGDRQRVIDGGDIATWLEGFEPDESSETFHRLMYIDSSMDIVYEYSDDTDYDAPWISTTVTYERKRSDASIGFSTMWLVHSSGLDGLEVEERSDLFRWGDESHFVILRDEDGDPVGNLFLARKGKMIYDVSFTGVYFDDADSIAELLSPALEAAATYRP